MKLLLLTHISSRHSTINMNSQIAASMRKMEKHITEEVDLGAMLLNAAKNRIRKLEQENYKLSTKKEQSEEERTKRRERDLKITSDMMRSMLSKLKSVLQEENEKMNDEYCWMMNRLEHRVDKVEKLEKARNVENVKLLQDLKERDEIIKKMKLQLAKLKKDEDTEKNKKRKRGEGCTEEEMETRGEEENSVQRLRMELELEEDEFYSLQMGV